LIKRKNNLYHPVIIFFSFLKWEYFGPGHKDETQQVDGIRKIDHMPVRIISEDIFDIQTGHQRDTVGYIGGIEKSVAVDICGAAVAVIQVDILGFDIIVFAKSYFEFKGIYRDIKEIEFIIFYYFSIDHRKKFLGGDKGNKHTCGIEIVCHHLIRKQ
jgi:hypothetical protein